METTQVTYWEQLKKLESLRVWERKTVRKVWSGRICSFLKKIWEGWLSKWVCIFPKGYHLGQGKRRPPITLPWRGTCEFCSPKLKAFVDAPSLFLLWSLPLSWPWKRGLYISSGIWAMQLLKYALMKGAEQTHLSSTCGFLQSPHQFKGCKQDKLSTFFFSSSSAILECSLGMWLSGGERSR